MDPAPEQPTKPGSHYQPSLSVVLVILVAFIAAAYLMLRTPSPATPGSATTTTVAGHHTTPTIPPPKSQVRVQVANGTSVTGLAREYTQQLLTIGWDTLSQVNAPSRVSKTVIYFSANYQWAAREIANEIKVPLTSVRARGGLLPVPGAAGDDVIVVLGPDAPLASG